MNEQEKDNDLRTIIHAIGDEVPTIDAAEIRKDAIVEEEPEPLLPPARSHWLTRLIATALLVWMGVVWSQAVVWGWSLNPWAGTADTARIMEVTYPPPKTYMTFSKTAKPSEMKTA